MRKSIIVAVAMTVGFGLAACGGNDEPAATPTTNNTPSVPPSTPSDVEPSTAPGDMGPTTEGDMGAQTGAMGDYAPGACTDFFQTAGTPLADRADTQRTALMDGKVTDDVTVSEVSLLEARIAELETSADPDIADLLTKVNAPFSEAVKATNDPKSMVLDKDGNPTGEYKLPKIDTAGSEAAQQELDTACKAG